MLFPVGHKPWNAGTGHKCCECNKRIRNKTSKRCRDCAMKLVAIKNKGTTRTLEQRKRISESHIGQKAWNKGKGSGRKYLYYPNKFRNPWFREEIKKCDNYLCQGCGITEEEHIAVFSYALSLHHIDYVKTNLSQDNLITVCHACNARANHNKEYWIKFYNKKIDERLINFVRGGCN